MLLKFDGYDKRWDFLDAEWEHQDPDGDYDEDYDGPLRTVHARAEHRVNTNAKADTIQQFYIDTVPTEVDDNFFQLRGKLITHYEIATAKHEVHWL